LQANWTNILLLGERGIEFVIRLLDHLEPIDDERMKEKEKWVLLGRGVREGLPASLRRAREPGRPGSSSRPHTGACRPRTPWLQPHQGPLLSAVFAGVDQYRQLRLRQSCPHPSRTPCPYP
jgi:hypothetical protein